MHAAAAAVRHDDPVHIELRAEQVSGGKSGVIKISRTIVHG
jgi:hypothetical protein